MTEKLVRDKIPDIIRATGEEPVIRSVRGAALCRFLREKLVEEAAEVLTAFSTESVTEELADLREVELAVMREYGITEEQVDAVRKTKAANRGVFNEGFIWEGNR